MFDSDFDLRPSFRFATYRNTAVRDPSPVPARLMTPAAAPYPLFSRIVDSISADGDPPMHDGEAWRRAPALSSTAHAQSAQPQHHGSCSASLTSGEGDTRGSRTPASLHRLVLSPLPSFRPRTFTIPDVQLHGRGYLHRPMFVPGCRRVPHLPSIAGEQGYNFRQDCSTTTW